MSSRSHKHVLRPKGRAGGLTCLSGVNELSSASVLFRFTRDGDECKRAQVETRTDNVKEPSRAPKLMRFGYLLIIPTASIRLREERALDNHIAEREERKAISLLPLPLAPNHPPPHPHFSYPVFSMRHRQTLRIPPLPMGVWCQSGGGVGTRAKPGKGRVRDEAIGGQLYSFGLRVGPSFGLSV